jgi:PAS domain S-box-containing protein
MEDSENAVNVNVLLVFSCSRANRARWQRVVRGRIDGAQPVREHAPTVASFSGAARQGAKYAQDAGAPGRSAHFDTGFRLQLRDSRILNAERLGGRLAASLLCGLTRRGSSAKRPGMSESLFDELKRYVRFGAEDERALRAFSPIAKSHYARIADEFYARLREHEHAHRVFADDAQVTRLKGTLQAWLERLFEGPWDDDYYRLRQRIGRVHANIALPQRFMFGAMAVIRVGLIDIVHANIHVHEERLRIVKAFHKLLDIELAIMLESYREAYVERVQELERLEKSHLERELALSEARYDEIVEKGGALVTTIDGDGRILLFNSQCERTTGLARREAAGRSWLETFIVEPDRATVRACQDEVLRGGASAPYEGPIAVRGPKERRVRWHFATLPSGATRLLCAFGLDVTAEFELGRRTRRAEKLAALGTMAAGLAHEIRNPLNAAHLQLHVARRKLQHGAGTDIDTARSAVQLAESEMRRLASLVEDFLQFARPQALRRSLVDVRETAEATLSLIGPQAAAVGVDLSLEPGEAVLAQIDDERIKQVLLNLVNNAIEATGPGGRIVIRVQASGDEALVTVADNGVGIPQNAPIFEPFFTTRPQGTGLGLAIVHRIINDHGGHIDVESRPGCTVFAISLPRDQPEGPATDRTPAGR